METDLNSTTIRDLFAMFAMAGMLADEHSARDGAHILSADAYKYADAMMEERNKDAT